MRICHIIGTDYGWGGLERCVTDLATHQSLSHDVAVLGTQDVLRRMGPAVKRVILPMHLSRRDPRLLWALRRALVTLKPDIVHAQAGKAASLVHNARWIIPRFPLVATVHGIKHKIGYLRGFDRVICVSRRAGEALGDTPFDVVWNAIPPTEAPVLPPDRSAFPFLGGPSFVVAAVGRLVEEKGFDVLLRAIKNVDASLWIIGDGALRPDLEALAKELGVDKRVWFTGFRKDVPTLVCLADLLVISSRREGFPLVLIEALNLKRPVIGTRVGAMDEIIPENWICEPEDSVGLSKLLSKALLKRFNLCTEFAPIFEIAQRELRLDAAAHKIELIYNKAIETTHPSTKLKKNIQ